MKQYKVLVADDDPIIRLDLVSILEQGGYEVIGEAEDGFEAVKMSEEAHPDLILMDIQMPLLNGLQAAKMIFERKLCDCILILTAFSDDKYVEEAVDQGILGYLVKPVSRQILLPAVKVALSRIDNIRQLRKEIEDANEVIRQRKIMERAKGILMKQKQYSEEKAYLEIKKMAMNKRCKMSEIAQIIILNEKR